LEGVAGKLCSKVCSNVYYIHLREERVLSIDLAIEEEIEARKLCSKVCSNVYYIHLREFYQ
jgi:hypothetical protein